MNKLIKSTIAGAALLIAPLSHAALVTDWDFTVTLEWDVSGLSGLPNYDDGYIFGPGTAPAESWQTATRLVWGSSVDYNGIDIGTTRSALIITDSSVTSSIQTNGAAEETNLITHYNNPLPSTFATLQSAVLRSTLILTPSGGSALPLFETFFKINFIETLNQTPCQTGSMSICDDIFVIDRNALNIPITYDGYNYFISITEKTGNLNPLAPAACTAAGIAAPCLGFQTQESLATEARFQFQITSEPVNIVAAPGILGLMGLGLMALVGVRRRK